MTTNGSYEFETKRHLDEAKKQLADIDSQIKGLQNDSTKLINIISAYETILRASNNATETETSNVPDWKSILSNKTNKEKVLLFGQQFNGKIIMNDIVDVFFSNKLVKSLKKNNIYIIVNGVINELIKEGKASKIKAGEYHISINQNQ